MGNPRAEDAERELGGNVGEGVSPPKFTACRGDETDSWIHVRA
jgi:hypothetical protein